MSVENFVNMMNHNSFPMIFFRIAPHLKPIYNSTSYGIQSSILYYTFDY
jgi:hypothetical protein